MSNILVYVRPWNKEQFVNLANLVWPESRKVYASDHKLFDESGYSAVFYKLYDGLKKNIILDDISFIAPDQIADVIKRCRLLRAIDYQQALKFIYCAGNSILKIINEGAFKYFFSVTVDSYVIHLFNILCCKNEIKPICIVPTFINGYFRVTSTGAKDLNREVSNEEVDKVHDVLTDMVYKPTWLASSKRDINKKAINCWLRNFIKPIWFRLLPVIKRDKYNTHYLTSRIISERYWSLIPQTYSGIDNVAELIEKLAEDERESIFLPLQMSPEATVDYWSEDSSWIDYEEKIFQIIKEYQHVVFVIKEHPNVLGFRGNGFYIKLKNYSNVYLVNSELSSNELIEITNAVLVCTGTVGFEAILRNKVVFSDANPFYVNNNILTSVSEMSSFVVKSDGGRDVKELVRYLLSGFLPGNFLNDGSWDKSNCVHKKFNEEIALSLKNNCIKL